jgi:exodeoxyribonuclease V alpha subunit
VEAGAVFRELLPPDGAAGDPRHRSAVRLTESFRMDPGKPEGRAIFIVAQAIKAGSLKGVLSGSGEPAGTADPATQAGTPPSAGEAVAEERGIERRARAADVVFTKVELLDGGSGKRPGGEDPERKRLLERWFGLHADADRWSDRIFQRSGGRFGEADEKELEEAFRHHGSFRILCLARGHAGGTGVEAVNAALHELAGAKKPGPVPGEPVLVRRNDYERELFNGDQGLVLRVKDGTGRVGPMAVFPGREGYRAFPLDAMRGDIDLAWAMTVHRSQGSEFQRVLVFLPEQDGPLLSREILYTAATRAKRSVVFVGSAELLAKAAGRPIHRDSGIGEGLARAGEVHPGDGSGEPVAGAGEDHGAGGSGEHGAGSGELHGAGGSGERVAGAKGGAGS